ncbi:MAG: thiamine pyrophosphate-dependent dehydrogenase E1 component subunit alpha [Pseudomonadota bacterium]|nr:thiamine pyrophosphate-dependent dehydrogenase E1 component subunit alpha [Pseudomonadota bacterium]
MQGFTKEVAETCHRRMVLIRLVEEVIANNYFPAEEDQKMRCPIHLSIGQEAAAVGVVEQLDSNAKIYSTHRCHAHYLARGGSIRKMLGELLGRQGGCLNGRGGSMHLKDLDVNFMMSIPIVGSVIPVAAGAALANKLAHKNGVVVVFIGDGSLEEGVWHETANFAVLNNLKILFVCENNLYSVYSKIDIRQPSRDLTRFAKAHEMAVFSGDGNSIEEVYQKAALALDLVNDGAPVLLKLDTYRQREHCGPNYDDHLGYRPEDEVKEWFARDPVKLSKNLLENKFGFTDEYFNTITSACAEEVETAFTEACSLPEPIYSNIVNLEYPL